MDEPGAGLRQSGGARNEMPTRIDHVVVVVAELDRAAADAAHAGFTVTPGGEHAGGYTHNALIPFADGSYVELIAFRKPQPAHKWWPHLQKAEGLVDFALLSDELVAEARAINERGLRVESPSDNGRLRPDGERLAWRAVQTQTEIGESGLPFLIEDVTARELRVPGEAKQTTHPNGATGIAGITVIVPDIQTGLDRFARLLGARGEPEQTGAEEVHAATIFPLGEQWIELIEPNEVELGADQREMIDDDPTDPNEDVVARSLELFGAGPFEVSLRSGHGTVGPREGELLDPALLHGARFRLAR